ncbi:MAG: PQQ-like beta-propeller repeat protein [Alphaproteobacteria bacterium]|nr:PQQ-like beta-propeller repeat protein [Alphaproteobacteria bacterium]
MKKVVIFVAVMFGLCSCDKHDPILPGERHSIFATEKINVLNTSVPDVPESIAEYEPNDCPYRLDNQNTIWNGDKKIFAGFPTSNYVIGQKNPVCSGDFVYAGLSTGELVKVNPKNRQIAWVADIYRQSNMTGGASVLDIIAPIQIHGKYVYAGGLGGAFCKISVATGNATWCTWIGVEYPFLIANDVAYVLDTDNNLNAIRLRDGAVYWRTAVEKPVAPKYKNKRILIAHENFDAETGKLVK